MRQAIEDAVIADLSNQAHADAIVYLLNEYAQDEMGGGMGLSDFTKRNRVPELRKRKGVFAVVAFAGEDPAGLALCMEGFSSFACKPLLNVHDMVVVRQYRGRGISKRLLEKVEEIARKLGCCKLTLEVLEGNEVARAAYKAFGFDGYQLDPKFGKALFWHKSLT